MNGSSRPGSLRVLLISVLLVAPLAAQLQWGGSPPSLGAEPAVRALFAAPPTASMEPVDVGAYLAEDALAGRDVPFRFGAMLSVDLGPGTAGEWTELPRGGRVWRLRIVSHGAYSISLVFSDYRVPAGASLWVYGDDLSTLLGAYDERNVKGDGTFAIEPVPGDAVTLEYFEPAAAAGQGALRIRGVVHDYRDLRSLLHDEEAGDGAECAKDVNCPEGAPWQAQKRALVLMLLGGSLCEGTLLNNTANDGAQYMLASHLCGDVSNATVIFNHEKSGCGSGSAPTIQTVNGTSLLATDYELDVRFVQISTPIPSSYQPYYLGWDRSGIAPPSTVAIHEPDGDGKKISFDDDPPVPSGNRWNILEWDDGATGPASWGSPLLDNTGHEIGQYAQGSGFCQSFGDGYTRFDQIWPVVKEWLDPLGSEPLVLEGLDPGPGGLPPVISSLGPSVVTSFQPGSVALTGSHFAEASSVSVGGVNLVAPGGFQVQDDTLISFKPPTLASLGPQSVTVTTPGGTSNAAQLTYAETLPPKMVVPVAVTSGNTLTWQYGGGALDSAFLLLAPDATTVPVKGSAVLSHFVILNVQGLPANGLGSYSVHVPAGLLFFTFYSQVVDVQDGTGKLLGATPVASTTIVF